MLLGWCLTLLSSALLGSAVYQVVLSEPHAPTVTGAPSGTRPPLPEPIPTPTLTRTIVRTVVDLACSLGMRVVREGVETYEQRRVLQHLGVHGGQGYFLGRPVPETSIATAALQAVTLLDPSIVEA